MDFFKEYVYPLLVPSILLLVPRLREWFFATARNIQLRLTKRANEKVDARIKLLSDLKDPSFAIPFFGSSILIALLILLFIFFFGFTMLYKGFVYVSGPGFIVFWYVGLIYIGNRIDLGLQASNYEKSMKYLTTKKNQRDNGG